MAAVRTLLLTVCLALTCAVPVFAHEEPVPPQLTVRGEAELRVPADQLRLTVGVVTDAPAASEALEKNNSRMLVVVAALRKAGLTEAELETGRLHIEPQWSPPPRQPSPDWRPQIVGYSATNTLRIRTGKIGAAGELIAAATAAGANDVGALFFDLADPRKHQAEAIRTATANALSDARALAEAAGVRLTRAQSLALDHAAPVPMAMAAERMVKVDAGAPPVSPGEVTVRAGVTVTYQIAPLGSSEK